MTFLAKLLAILRLTGSYRLGSRRGEMAKTVRYRTDEGTILHWPADEPPPEGARRV